MREDQAPFAWLGEPVRVSVIGIGSPLDGELFEVNDKGVVLRITTLGEESVDPRFSFHSWETINMLAVLESNLEREGSSGTTEE